MTNTHVKYISAQLSIAEKQVLNTLQLLSDGCTIPFIARYRKEATSNLDEIKIENIRDLNIKLTTLEKRKETILKTIEEQGVLTEALKTQIETCFDLNELEDIYLPYKPKRKTRATKAKELGLEPLAKKLMAQHLKSVQQTALEYITKEVLTVEDALSGARDIIAEWVNENQKARNTVRYFFKKEGVLTTKVIKSKLEEAEKYKDYFDFSEPLNKCVSHRYLAICRGENEGFLKVSAAPDSERCLEKLESIFHKESGEAWTQVSLAIQESYKRLIQPSIESEFRNLLKEKADLEAIKVFAENLKQLLLTAPLGEKRVLAIDPGYRTGCKVVCLDEKGMLLHNETIYPHPPQNETTLAMKKITSLINSCKIEAIAIGNGTASRETEHFIKRIKFDRDLLVFIVNEQGASIYSASPIAREEFPEYDVTVRGAVSIGRRLTDPLAELVKIDPKSIGVGQYQHDVDQNNLKKSLDQVVEYCVNSVGVNLNTASKYLLTYVSGLGPQLAQNIVDYRNQNGMFESREQLKQVPRMGAKAFEQCAGFLRIQNAKNPLDNSAVHPESYILVEKMAKELKVTLHDLIQNETLCAQINKENYLSDSIGLITITDILAELAKPSRDPRKTAQIFEFDKNIKSIDDLEIGMVVPGIVSNITNFGAFVDIGVKQDGLVHISNLANQFISNPSDYVKLQQQVQVKIIDVDKPRKRIQLSMKDL